MGEYAKFNGQQVKLGTCESMYYISLIEYLKKQNQLSELSDNYLKPNSYRFRFPFPDEDNKCFDFDDFQRGVLFEIPVTYKMEFSHDEMFIRTDSNVKTKGMPIGMRIKCPISKPENIQLFDWGAFQFHHFEIIQQKIVKENDLTTIQTVVRCPYCGSLCRLSFEEAKEIERWWNDLTKEDKEHYKDKGIIIKRMIAGYDAEMTEKLLNAKCDYVY